MNLTEVRPNVVSHFDFLTVNYTAILPAGISKSRSKCHFHSSRCTPVDFSLFFSHLPHVHKKVFTSSEIQVKNVSCNIHSITF